MTTIYRDHRQGYPIWTAAAIGVYRAPIPKPRYCCFLDVCLIENLSIDLRQVELDEFRRNDCQRWNFIPDVGTNLPAGMYTRHVSRIRSNGQIR